MFFNQQSDRLTPTHKSFPNQRIQSLYRTSDELLNFSQLSWWIIDLDDNPNVFYCNDTMCDTFDLDKQAFSHSVKDVCPIAGDYNSNIALSNSGKAEQIFDEYQQLKSGEIDEYSNSFPYFDPNTRITRYFSSRAKALIKNSQGNASLLFGIIEPEALSEELYKIAKRDGLTNLYNRREFDSKLSFLLNLAVREDKEVSLIMCDVDHFKAYNDALGHCAGDECLISVAEVIRNTCKRSSDMPFRYGGEEFAVIVYGGKQQVMSLAERIRQEILACEIPHPAGSFSFLTISVGCCTIKPTKETENQDLIECADQALYQAKEKGRNRSISLSDDCR